MKITRSALLAAAMLGAVPAMAQFRGPPPFLPFYIGGGVGRGNLNVSGTDLTGLSNAHVDDSGTTYTARFGMRVAPHLAIEAAYYDLGKYKFEGQGAVHVTGEAKAKSVGVSLVGILPLRQAELYGRIGWAHSEVKLNASGALGNTPYNASETQDEATYGVGARWNVARNWGVFAEWMKNDKIEVDSYLIGFDFRF
jgi:hypothetical protein